ncbi:rho guanine nucleotide exchange factor 19 [Ambystoma mexicanum]|uniref:rho guanine nucleotide exchange factor 19 n=1 Tax=Ambystoma mexicanum TaxID=8296 RepID=UPI0037E975E5
MEYRPLPDFQPHLKSLPYGRERAPMRTPVIGEAVTRGDTGLNERPYAARHHIAVYQQDSVSFGEMPNVWTDYRVYQCAPDNQALPGATISRTDSPASPRLRHEHWALNCQNYADRPPTGRNQDSRASNMKDSEGRDLSSGVGDHDPPREAAGCPSPQGRQVVGKADSWPHGTCFGPSVPSSSSHSDSSLDGLLTGLPSPKLQRRASQGSDRDKSAWRKIRVYSPDRIISSDPLSGSHLEDDSVFAGAVLQQDCADGGCPTGGTELLAGAVPEILGLSLSSVPIGKPTEHERRRFSASELISKLQLSQRRATFSLKLGKSLSAKVSSKAGAGQEGKPVVIQRRCNSSAGDSPLNPTAPLPGEDERSERRNDSPEERDVGRRPLQCLRRQSRFLLNSILYQEYNDVAINREIQRQQREDTPAEEEEDGDVSPKTNLSPTSSFRSQRSSRGSTFSLWQDIPDVRGSGVLATLSTQERKLREAKFELITSESSYIHSLSITVDHFLNSPELHECLGAQDKQWLFSKLPEVKDVSERFLQDLEERLEEDVLCFDVCDIVLTHCPEFRRVYLPYVTNQAYQEQTYQRLLLENPRFPGILAKLEEDQICQRLPLTSFLILPFQRIMRLKMLVENILKQTTQGSRDEDTATKAFNELKKLVKECNASVQSMKRTEELIHLNKKIHFESKIFPLISQSRWLVKHGELVEVDLQMPTVSGAKLKLLSKPVYLHLFNDCLLLSRKKEIGKFAVFVYAKMPELRVNDLSKKLQGVPGHVFHLQLFENRLLKHQILLRAQTESEKQRWISAMFPPNPQTDGDMLMENEDIPQVQCIKAYKAQEHDELSLEKADILGLKTRTSDGWIEGIRLSDGERGWIPKTHVEEIASKKARLRNLRENNRIKHATQKLEERV